MLSFLLLPCFPQIDTEVASIDGPMQLDREGPLRNLKNELISTRPFRRQAEG